MIAAGYCITSRKWRMASRIDRPDWKEYMAEKHAPWNPKGDGMKWVNLLGNGAGDHYRRCYSKDNITVSESERTKLPKSQDGPNEFKEKK